MGLVFVLCAVALPVIIGILLSRTGLGSLYAR